MRLCVLVLMVTLQTRSHSLLSCLSCLSTVMPRQILAQDILIKDVQSLSTVLYVEENAEVMTVDFLLAWGESESLVSGHHHQGLLRIQMYEHGEKYCH